MRDPIAGWLDVTLSTQLAFDVITNRGYGINVCGRYLRELYHFDFAN